MLDKISVSSHAAVDTKQLQKLLLEAFSVGADATGKDIVLVIGNTGAGKSTTINYLLGCPMVAKKQGARGVIAVQDSAQERAIIGHAIANSETLYPSLFKIRGDDYYLCDCPGFVDTRGPEYEITAAISTKVTINAARYVKSIVIVLPQTAITEEKAAGLRSIFLTLQKLLGQKNNGQQETMNAEYLRKSVTFVITKRGFDPLTGERVDTKELLIEVREEHVAQSTVDSQNIVFMCDLILENTDGIIEIEPLDKGESGAKLLKRFRQSTQLLPNYFGLPAGANTERILQDMLGEIAVDGATLFKHYIKQSEIIHTVTQTEIEKKLAIKDLEQKINEANNRPDIDNHGSLLSLKKICDRAEEEADRLKEKYKERSWSYDFAHKKFMKTRHGDYDYTPNLYSQLEIAQGKRDKASRKYDSAQEHFAKSKKKYKYLRDELRSIQFKSKIKDLEDYAELKKHFELELYKIQNTVAVERSTYRSIQDRLSSKLKSYVLLIKIISVVGDLISEKIKTFLGIIENSAECGHPEGQFLMGKLREAQKLLLPAALFYDRASRQKYEEAQECLGELVEAQYALIKDDSYAQYFIGVCFEEGIYYETDIARALTCYKKSVKQVFYPAAHRLGLLYELGKGVDRDLLAAMRCYSSAADYDVNAEVCLKKLLHDLEGNVKTWYPDLEKQYCLGMCYMKGIGIKQNYLSAFGYLKAAADRGHIGSQFAVAQGYENGTGTEQNTQTALCYYQKSAVAKNKDAEAALKRIVNSIKAAVQEKDPYNQYLLGICYLEGYGVLKNDDSAFDCFLAAEKQSYPAAIYYVGWFHEHEISKHRPEDICSEDVLSVMRYYHRAANDVPDAKSRLKKFLDKLEANANARYPDLEKQYCLGMCYARGIGVNQNYECAFTHLKTAADNAHAGAQFSVAQYYGNGTGTEKDTQMALCYYQKSAKGGNRDAEAALKQIINNIKEAAQIKDPYNQYLLGICYLEGYGVPKDDDSAFEWFLAAKEQGHSLAVYYVGWFYEYGIGKQRSQDILSAMHCYHCAADDIPDAKSRLTEFLHLLTVNTKAKHKDPEKQYYLGRCYAEGIGVKQNYLIAFEHFKAAADKKHAAAQFSVAQCYEDGVGIERDIQMALCYYKQSAESKSDHAKTALKKLVESIIGQAVQAGNPYNQYLLGICYLEGYFVSRDDSSAFTWFSAAEKQGYSPAIYYIGWFYEVGKVVSQNILTALRHYSRAANYDVNAEAGLKRLLHDFEGNIKAKNPNLEKQYYLGICHAEGIGIEQNFISAFNHLEIAAAKGHMGAQFSLGQYYENGTGTGKNLQKALSYYKKSAEGKNNHASVALKKLFEFIVQSVQEGDPESQYLLGICYLEGYFVSKDYGEAFKLFSAAANKNIDLAKYWLGRCYEEGWGIASQMELPQSKEIMAMRYYKAANKNQDCVQQGSVQKGEKLFQSIHDSAEQKKASSQYDLSICYKEGLGRDVNDSQAERWLYCAKKQKYGPAYNDLSTFYENQSKENFLSKSDSKKYKKKSLKYQEKAGKYGISSATFSLAEKHEKGEDGIKQNSKKAKKLYQIAHEQNHPNALEAMNRLNNKKT